MTPEEVKRIEACIQEIAQIFFPDYSRHRQRPLQIQYLTNYLSLGKYTDERSQTNKATTLRV